LLLVLPEMIIILAAVLSQVDSPLNILLVYCFSPPLKILRQVYEEYICPLSEGANASFRQHDFVVVQTEGKYDFEYFFPAQIISPIYSNGTCEVFFFYGGTRQVVAINTVFWPKINLLSTWSPENGLFAPLAPDQEDCVPEIWRSIRDGLARYYHELDSLFASKKA